MEKKSFQPSFEASSRRRTYSTESIGSSKSQNSSYELSKTNIRRRRGSQEETFKEHRFLLDVDETQELILAQEDTDNDLQITVNDVGPKVLKLGTADSSGFRKIDIRGTYMLSNLLQELALARDGGRKYLVVEMGKLNENPVKRLSRMISTVFWKGLTRRMDAEGLELICKDPKNKTGDHRPRVYVPYRDQVALDYYTDIAQQRPHLNLEVIKLPEKITPEYVKSINKLPGILSLALVKEEGTLRGAPFVVPGGRFNEMYGWDSYFESIGLLIDGRVDLAKGMVENFVYQIKHYGKILNANRSYYLTRSQPPFLTDMALRVYEKLPQSTPDENKKWLNEALKAAIKEYWFVWMSLPRYDPESGLSRYRPTGMGMPPETESTHFDHIILPYCTKHGLSIEEFNEKFGRNEIQEPDLDSFFIHDRAVRESGHDTTYRLDRRCGNLATVDLNSLLYKYEMDIGMMIEHFHSGEFVVPLDPVDDLQLIGPQKDVVVNEDRTALIEKCQKWYDRAKLRQELVEKYCWNEDRKLYMDYDTVQKCQSTYESVTAMWTLYAGLVPKEKVASLVESCRNKFEEEGGLVSGTEESRGTISLDRPNRQWDYPFGWAPHQMLAWIGLRQYGHMNEARILVYRWLYMITKSFVDFNGVVPEKFDVVNMSHLLDVEYGNVGVDFKFVPKEGFGWMNASYQLGLHEFCTKHMRRALGTLTPPESFFSKTAGQLHFQIPGATQM